MKERNASAQRSRTAYVRLDTRACKACWDCVDACKQKVIGKVNLPWHKHARIVNPSKCTGCLKCVKACAYAALTKVDDTEPVTIPPRKRFRNSSFINLLLFSALVMVLSGLILQFGFHIGGKRERSAGIVQTSSHSVEYKQATEIETSNAVWDLTYQDWSITHKSAIVLFSLLMVYHFYRHRKWYKYIFLKHLVRKNIQLVSLTIVFLLVAITGFVPWAIDLSGASSFIRFIFIEIHDKLALVLVVYLVLHVVKRVKWFNNSK